MPPAQHGRTRQEASPISLPTQSTQSGRKLHGNQHLPCHQFSISLLALLVLSTLSFTAPNDDLKPLLELFFHLGMSDTDIATSVMDHFDSARYGLRYDPMLLLAKAKCW